MEKENWLCIAFNSTDYMTQSVAWAESLIFAYFHSSDQFTLYWPDKPCICDNSSFLPDKRCLCIAVAWLVVVSTAAARDLDTKSPGNIWGGGGSVLRMMILMIRIITIRIIMIGVAFMSMVYQVNIGRRRIMVAHFLDDNDQD